MLKRIQTSIEFQQSSPNVENVHESQAQALQKSFRQTRLYAIIEKRAASDGGAKRIVAVVDEILDRAEQVLHVASTSPLDFTLHDNQHSFRVAEKMVGVLPPGMPEQLGNAELALLLLSAYLHDIGMTPEREVILRYRDLIVGDESRVDETGKEDFYSWFDSTEFGDAIKLPLRTSDPSGLNQLEEVLTYYVRAKHNEWSARWIERNLSQFPLEKYPEFKADLTRLCTSHHYGLEELTRDEYNPKQIGISEKPVVVNLRYLACVLRVADILDFDPERTPDVIYRHRNIAPRSRIFWYQNFYINSSPSSDRKKWIFDAHPPDATIHQALRTVAADINRELQLCHQLNNARPFSYSVSGNLLHHWDLPQELTVNISPQDDAYVFIEGAFRPNNTRLLQMLSGTNLYSSELDGLRELIQNAFDAIKELIAYEILHDPATVKGSELVSDALAVEIRIEKSDGRLFVVCGDQGVGMTKNIIENYVLVSGNSRSRQLRFLEL